MIAHLQAVDESNQSKDEAAAQHGEYRESKIIVWLGLWIQNCHSHSWLCLYNLKYVALRRE